MVLLAILIAGVFFWFIYANVVEGTQNAIDPSLAEDKWASPTHYLFFAYANNFLSSFWTYLVAFVVVIAGYWIWIYSQRKAEGF